MQEDVGNREEHTARRMRIAGERSTISGLSALVVGLFAHLATRAGTLRALRCQLVPHELEVGEGARGQRAGGVLRESAIADLRER